MNILEYIEWCMGQGMSEDDACRCADMEFNSDYDDGEN